MTGKPDSFDEIMEPLGGQRFLDEYLDIRPLHLEGPPDKWQAVMSWDVLSRLLGMTTIWSQNSLVLMLDTKPVPVAAYTAAADGRDGGKVLRPDPVRVKRLLAQGATLVLNDIDQLTPELSSFCDALEGALGAKLQANLYMSSRRKQGFRVHYDTHDVFAVHVMGEKTWMVFEGRGTHPIAHPLFKNQPAEHHEQAKGKLWKEVRLKPGHLLYLPRGQYHYALADEQPCAHIAFGATYPIGLDLVSYLFEGMVQEPIARANLPRDGQALTDRLAAIADCAHALLTDRATLTAAQGLQANFRYQRVTYELPGDIAGADQRYRVKVSGLRLVEHHGRVGLVREGSRQVVEVPIPLQPLVTWVLERQRFTRQELTDAFAAQGGIMVDQFLAAIAQMEIIGIEP